MRSLSTTLTNASTALNKQPIWKLVLSRAAASTRAYDQTRVTDIAHTESPASYSAEVVLRNSDTTLTALDFEHYQMVLSYGYKTGVTRSAWGAASAYAIDDIVIPSGTAVNGFQYRCSIAGTTAASQPSWSTTLGITIADSSVTWEMDGSTGDEYSRTAPLRVRSQSFHSGRGILKCVLRAEGIVNQLDEDKAASSASFGSAVTTLVQDYITNIAGTAVAAYSSYTAYTVVYDSTDGIIGTFAPADYFSITLNESRWSKVEELLDYTKCKAREEADGKLHVLLPTTSGTAYNQEYKFNVSGSHNFWNKELRLRFVNPNQEIVISSPDHSPSYSGTATSASSFALAPKTHTTYRRLTSNAQAGSIAAAIMDRRELDAERGFATVPMNVGQELWDYVNITDSRENDSRTGNIQYLQRNVAIHDNNQPLTWTMNLAFGKVTQQSLLANGLTEGGGRLSTTDLLLLIEGLTETMEIFKENQNILFDAVKELRARDTVPKWRVAQQLQVPSAGT